MAGGCLPVYEPLQQTYLALIEQLGWRLRTSRGPARVTGEPHLLAAVSHAALASAVEELNTTLSHAGQKPAAVLVNWNRDNRYDKYVRAENDAGGGEKDVCGRRTGKRKRFRDFPNRSLLFSPSR